MRTGLTPDLVARPYSETPSFDDLPHLTVRWTSEDNIRLVHGLRDITIPFRGAPIAFYRKYYSCRMNVDPDASAFVNGAMVWDCMVPQPGDILEFIWPWGRKGDGIEEDVDYF